MIKYIIEYQKPFNNPYSLQVERVEINAITESEAIKKFYVMGFYMPKIISIQKIKT